MWWIFQIVQPGPSCPHGGCSPKKNTHTHVYKQPPYTDRTVKQVICGVYVEQTFACVTLECVGMSKLMTQSTCGMSKPREATSVASSTDRDFDLNLFRAPRRLFYTEHTQREGDVHAVLPTPTRGNNNMYSVYVPGSFARAVGWRWCPGSSVRASPAVCCCTYCRKPWTSSRLIRSVWRPGSSPKKHTHTKQYLVLISSQELKYHHWLPQITKDYGLHVLLNIVYGIAMYGMHQNVYRTETCASRTPIASDSRVVQLLVGNVSLDSGNIFIVESYICS